MVITHFVSLRLWSPPFQVLETSDLATLIFHSQLCRTNKEQSTHMCTPPPRWGLVSTTLTLTPISPSSNANPSSLFSQLGEAIGPMKEDFIMVHMHPTCSHCRDFIMFGNRWSCRGKNCDFRLCDTCHAAENARPMEQRHPLGDPEKHTFFAQVRGSVPGWSSFEGLRQGCKGGSWKSSLSSRILKMLPDLEAVKRSEAKMLKAPLCFPVQGRLARWLAIVSKT